jgi:hypothetical protein
VYDLTGNEIETVENANRQAGSYTVSFDAGRLSNGEYIYRITANKFSAAKKLIINR